jgi:HK97 family phage major capsid protein
MGQLEQAKAAYSALRDQAIAITEKAIAEKRDLTDDETTKLGEVVEKAKAAEQKVKEAQDQTYAPRNADALVDALLNGTGTKGEREPHVWTKALMEGSSRGAFGEKGVTGGGQGSVVVGSLGDPAAQLGAPGGEILALLSVESWGERGDGSVVSFLRETSRTLRASVVPVGTAKPSSDIGLDMVSADSWTFAHNVGAVPLQWLQDAGNLDTLIRSELVYGVQMAVEKAIVSGAGPLPGLPLGIIPDPAVLQTDYTNNVPDSILAGLTAVASAGYSTGVVALNPADWEAILAMKDLQERYQFRADSEW